MVRRRGEQECRLQMKMKIAGDDHIIILGQDFSHAFASLLLFHTCDVIHAHFWGDGQTRMTD